MRVVIDTNILVSGLLRPFSPPGEIVREITRGRLKLCIDGRILSEYTEVLRRPKFDFDPILVEDLLELIKYEGEYTTPEVYYPPLPDEDDRPFIEVAIGGQVECLVTGNVKHFPTELKVMSPRDFVSY